jgi:outer membrane protease
MDTAGQRLSVPDSTHLPSPISNASALPEDSGNGMMYDFSWMDNAQIDADFWMNLPDHPLLS